jgi:hypothetical protein
MKQWFQGMCHCLLAQNEIYILWQYLHRHDLLEKSKPVHVFSHEDISEYG